VFEGGRAFWWRVVFSQPAMPEQRARSNSSRGM
jgi:hypothetical protein